MPRSASLHFDVCIIGCGPGGFAAAMRALDLGKHVCIVEKAQIGGAGVMWGALASKTMWELAKDFDVACKTGRGYQADAIAVDYGALRNTVLTAIREKQEQMRTQLKAFSPEKWNGPGSITFKRGEGTFISPHRLALICGGRLQEEISADFFLIATGAKPRSLRDVAVDQKRVLDSDGILRLKSFPRRLMIVGAGIVGCEYATIFSNFGQTEVVILDHQDQILPFEDPDISHFVSDHLRQNNVNIMHAARLCHIESKSDGLEIEICQSDTRFRFIKVDALLLSIGRVPNLSGLGLEKAGIKVAENGRLPADNNCRICDHIYAAGDVTAHPALVNLAETEGRYAVKHMYGVNRWPLRYDNMSTVMFFSPPVAAVGLNEKQCREQKIAYRVASYANCLVNRAIAMRSVDGFVKIIVGDDEEQKILGMRAAGPQASSTIMTVAMLMDQGKGIRDVLKSVHPHPTMSEGIQECLRLLVNKSIYKPHAFPEKIKVRSWHSEPGPDPGAA
ncbi:MAG: NAD(P)/FAD-dependent oxidoreductase [Deltaproteobacteria bacterium]|nr:MAG: NAD(P)/FAD-dependent oxidoreductase [Deltaproteobacteria bacterium]